jgi:hypothetical protein
VFAAFPLERLDEVRPETSGRDDGIDLAATFTEMKAPTKFSSAASPTATLGFKAFVAIEVAMALAVS